MHDPQPHMLTNQMPCSLFFTFGLQAPYAFFILELVSKHFAPSFIGKNPGAFYRWYVVAHVLEMSKLQHSNLEWFSSSV